MFVFLTNPQNPDTDGDLLTDGDEVLVFFTNPLLSDTDADMVGDGIEVHCGSGALNASSGPERIDGLFLGVDDDGDTEVDEPLPTGSEDYDCDGDGFIGSVEAFIVTEAQAACPATLDQDDEQPDAWPPDFDDNQVINLMDLFYVLPPYYGTSPPNPNYNVRWDLVPDGTINISDVFKVLPPYFGSTCTP